MSNGGSITADRVAEARRAYAELPHGGHDDAVLHVQCANSHHVAIVYATPAGLVYRAQVHPRSHGSRDRVDEPHGATPPEWLIDFVEAGPDADDALPAWCDCGARTLSRAALASWVAAHEGRVVVD